MNFFIWKGLSENILIFQRFLKELNQKGEYLFFNLGEYALINFDISKNIIADNDNNSCEVYNWIKKIFDIQENEDDDFPLFYKYCLVGRKIFYGSNTGQYTKINNNNNNEFKDDFSEVDSLENFFNNSTNNGMFIIQINYSDSQFNYDKNKNADFLAQYKEHIESLLKSTIFNGLNGYSYQYYVLTSSSWSDLILVISFANNVFNRKYQQDMGLTITDCMFYKPILIILKNALHRNFTKKNFSITLTITDIAFGLNLLDDELNQICIPFPEMILTLSTEAMGSADLIRKIDDISNGKLSIKRSCGTKDVVLSPKNLDRIKLKDFYLIYSKIAELTDKDNNLPFFSDIKFNVSFDEQIESSKFCKKTCCEGKKD